MLAELAWVSLASRASHRDSNSVTLVTIRFCSARGGSGNQYFLTLLAERFGWADPLSN